MNLVEGFIDAPKQAQPRSGANFRQAAACPYFSF